MTVLMAIGGFVAILGCLGHLGQLTAQGSCGGKGGPDCVCDDFEQRKCAARKKMSA